MHYLCKISATLLIALAPLTGVAQTFSAIIERDEYGVPHIYGETDADAAFGLAYAQGEDAWSVIEASVPYYRGTAGRYFGPDAARSDFLVRWLGLWDTIDARYQTDLSPTTRRYLDAFAAGLNKYAEDHRHTVELDILPVTAQDLIAAHMLRHLLFYGFDDAVAELTGNTRARTVAQPRVPAAASEPIGSNAFAVGPDRSDDGSTMLAINSHQPLTGPVAWYEAHLMSGEGLNIMGGLFPGAPTIGVGFTEHHAWGATVNKPDLVDTYVLEMHPQNPNQYRLDGEWHDLEVFEVELDVRIWGFIPWSVTRTAYRSAHGPVMKTDHGVYAVRYAGMGELRQVEQWLAMNKANNFDEWREALRLHYIASFNFVYADREGNIYFVHNSLTPLRSPGYDWQQYLPGTESSLIWDEYLDFDDLPQVLNPESGYVHSANQSPLYITDAISNPRAADYPDTAGWQTNITNRALRGIELFTAMGKISFEELSAIKHDNAYSPNYWAMDYLEAVKALPSGNDAQAQALQLLHSWDLSTTRRNQSAALGVCIIRTARRSEAKGIEPPLPAEALDACMEEVEQLSGRLDPPWGEVNRHGRGGRTWPVAGGPDTLRAIHSRVLNSDDFRTATAGDGLYYLIRWSADGEQTVLGVHQYGSNMQDPDSPHYLDQAEDFANESPHTPRFDIDPRKGDSQRRYRVAIP